MTFCVLRQDSCLIMQGSSHAETQVAKRVGKPGTLPMASAVFTGTVLFSTMILEVVDTLAIMRAAPSQYARSAALPAPTPVILVGVFTLHRPGQHNQAGSLPTTWTPCLDMLHAPNDMLLYAQILFTMQNDETALTQHRCFINSTPIQPRCCLFCAAVCHKASSSATLAHWASQHCSSVTRECPDLTKTMFALAMWWRQSVEKNRLRPRQALTTSSRPGS